MLRLTVAAHPGSRIQRVEMLENGVLGVWVRARAIEGQANTAIELAVASALGLRARQVHIVGGATGRRKIVDIDVADLDMVRERLHANEAWTD